MINDYIDKTIGFYFDDGFDQMIDEAQLDEEDIQKWGSIAVLFEVFVSGLANPNNYDKDDVLSLVEDLYIKLEVNQGVRVECH